MWMSWEMSLPLPRIGKSREGAPFSRKEILGFIVLSWITNPRWFHIGYNNFDSPEEILPAEAGGAVLRPTGKSHLLNPCMNKMLLEHGFPIHLHIASGCF